MKLKNIQYILKISLVFFSFIFCNIAQAEFALVSKTKGIKKFLNEVEIALPEKLKQTISWPIKVEFSNFNNKPICKSGKFTKTVKAGYMKNKWLSNKSDEIFLNIHFLDSILKETSKSCGGFTYYELIKTTLIHEISHIYDFYLPSHQSFIKVFDDNNKGQGFKKPMPKGRVTGNLQFLALANYSNFQDLNLSAWSSFNTYELSNIKEFFSVNFAKFLEDPSYACRKPALYTFLANHFEHWPKTNCTTNYKIYTNTGQSFVLDPSRLHSVQFLLGGPGRALHSWWGHVYINFVFCAPGKAKTDPSCLKDVSHHVALELSAYAPEKNILKGLFGGYVTSMHFASYSTTLYKAETQEKRSLKFYPIFFNEQQKDLFLKKTLETFWNYNSNYLFLKNNCVNEIANLILSVLPESRHTKSLKEALTPKSFKAALYHAKLTDSSYRANNIKTINSPYTKQKNAIKILRPFIPANIPHAEAYLKSDISTRKLIFEHILEQTRLDLSSENIKLLKIFNFMEKAIINNLSEEIRSKISKAQKKSEKTILNENKYTPRNFVNESYQYGVPLKSETLSDDNVFSLWEKNTQKISHHLDLVNTELSDTLKEEISFLSQNYELIRELQKELQELQN